MTEGTKSVLFGAHSVIHSYFVAKSWRLLYGKWPTFKECIVILLHDVGYCGMDYLSNRSNAGHAELGARICGRLLGKEHALLALGHSSAAQKKYGIPQSKLELPDEYSWVIAPLWWMKLNHCVERFPTTPEMWKKAVTDNFNSKNKKSGTELLNSLRSPS